VDEYEKSGPKSASSLARTRDREQKRLIQKMLDIEEESDFIQALKSLPEIVDRPSAYQAAIRIWREKHRSR